jgi:hypothetical protein
MNINVLFVATSLNRLEVDKVNLDDSYDDMPELIDENGIVVENITELELNYKEYFNLIKNTIQYDDIKYLTIDPVYTNVMASNTNDDINYIGHIPTLLEDISLDKYTDFFDCVFITSAYLDIFNETNINILKQILKKNSFLITTYPNGISELKSNFTRILKNETKINTLYNIFTPVKI